jgi:hypothetical protein
MKKAFILTMTTLLWISCPTGVTEKQDFDLSHSPAFEEASTLFLSDPVTGEKVFSINTVSTLLNGGATYWSETVPEGPHFHPFEVILRKSSGHGGGGFGFYFSQRDSDRDSFSAPALFINIYGEYCAGVIHDRIFEYVLPWTGSEYLIKGYGQNNIIGIEAGSEPGQYTILFNGNFVNQWVDPSDTVHLGSGLGYLAVVTPLENFPSVPVIIRYRNP